MGVGAVRVRLDDAPIKEANSRSILPSVSALRKWHITASEGLSCSKVRCPGSYQLVISTHVSSEDEKAGNMHINELAKDFTRTALRSTPNVSVQMLL